MCIGSAVMVKLVSSLFLEVNLHKLGKRLNDLTVQSEQIFTLSTQLNNRENVGLLTTTFPVVSKTTFVQALGL